MRKEIKTWKKCCLVMTIDIILILSLFHALKPRTESLHHLLEITRATSNNNHHAGVHKMTKKKTQKKRNKKFYVMLAFPFCSADFSLFMQILRSNK